MIEQAKAIIRVDGGSVQPPNEDGVIHILDKDLEVVDRITPEDDRWEEYIELFYGDILEKAVVKN